MTRFIIYIDEDGKKRVKIKEEMLEKENEEKRKKEEKNRMLNIKLNNEKWLRKWIEKRRTVKQEKFVMYLRSVVPKKRWNEKLIKRIVYKMDIGHIDECWNWLGSCNQTGYGMTMIDGKTVVVHRFIWIMIHGEIPEDMYVLHKCDNRGCTNCNHLFIGTQQDNMDDMKRKGRSPDNRGENNPNSVINWNIVNEIRELWKTGNYSHRKMAKIFGISKSEIGFIVRNEYWSDKEYQKWIDSKNKNSC